MTIMPLITKCRKLVGTFKHSTSLSEQLTNTIRNLRSTAKPLYECLVEDDDLELGMEELETLMSADAEASKLGLRTKLIQDLVTRWNSTLCLSQLVKATQPSAW
jgi:hypothetical protein